MSDLDVKTVETTRDLISLIRDQSASSSIFDSNELSNEEVIELAQVLVRKIWERRRGVALTGTRLANMLVKMTADKLEKGEREIMVLPEMNQAPDAGDETIHEGNYGIQSSSSSRLEDAKQLLAQFEREV